MSLIETLVGFIFALVIYQVQFRLAEARYEPASDGGLICGSGLGLQAGVGEESIFDSRIVGGQAARAGQFPFMAYVVDQDTATCGGVIIDEWHILTAAHCVTMGCGSGEGLLLAAASKLSVAIGTIYHSPSTGRQPLGVSKVMIHKSFCKDGQLRHDIAILRTEKRMEFQITVDGVDTVNAICLPQPGAGNYQPKEEALVAGWGRTQVGYPDGLQFVHVQLVSRKHCRVAYKLKGISIDPSDQICASSSGGKDSCDGDSGGPLFRQLPSGQFELIGLVSTGAATCAHGEIPTIHTRVSKYIHWIHRSIKME